MKLQHLLYTVLLPLIALALISCNNAATNTRPSNASTDVPDPENQDCFMGLTNPEKKLISDIIHNMRLDKDSLHPHKIEGNSFTYAYIKSFYIRKQFDPINPMYAQMLVKNYDVKRGVIEVGFRNRMRDFQAKTSDTRSVWIPTNEIMPFITTLVKYELDSSKLTGINIAFGSYPYNKTEDDRMTGARMDIRTNSDSLSGRTTLIFYGTADTSTGKDYNVLRHRGIPTYITAFGTKAINGTNQMPDSYNHGTLCPDSCLN
jgi:hypothetical protein